MFTKFGLPIIAIALIAFAVKYLADAKERIPVVPPPPTQPPENPFREAVAGAGMVEPQTQNISVGSPLAGVVVAVLADVGKKVKASDPLFRLDDRQLKAELAVRKAMLADAQAELDRLDAMPRKEELPQSEARIREAKADWDNWEQQWSRGEKMLGQKAISDEDFLLRKQSAIQARERYNRAAAEYNLLAAGAWEPDKRLAQAAVEHAKAQVQQIETDLDRLVIRALVDGEVLQVNVRPGEFVGAPANQALVVLGNVNQLHVRVDIDEYDIPRFVPQAPAKATLKGQSKDSFPLRFVRIEPYVVPKRSLTGDNTERVDTRVLQVIYAIDTQGKRLFVGQQLDVFIEATGNNPALIVLVVCGGCAIIKYRDSVRARTARSTMATVDSEALILPYDTVPRLFTVADLEALPSDLPSGPIDYELDNGRLVFIMVPPGDTHGAVQSNLAFQLKLQAEFAGHGKARTEVGVVLWRNPDRVVTPDVLFIANKSLPLRHSTEGYLETIPELVVEVRSKNDSLAYIQHKVDDYLRAGVEVVWVADPSPKTVIVHTPQGKPAIYGEADTLKLPDLIPEFSLSVRDVFRD